MGDFFTKFKFSRANLSPIRSSGGASISRALEEAMRATLRRVRDMFMSPGGARFRSDVMIDRPLVFGNEVPSIMIYHEQIDRFHSFLESESVRYETSPFQRSFELIKFPSLSHERVEELLDRLGRKLQPVG